MKKYATEERNNPLIIDQIDAAIVSDLNKDELGYRGGTGGRGGKGTIRNPREHLKFVFLLYNWDVLSRYIMRKFGTPILKGVNGSTRTKTNQSTKSNLSMENPQR